MNRKKLLAPPQQALWDYLDALLQEIPPDLPHPEPESEIQSWDPKALEPDAVKPSQPVKTLARSESLSDNVLSTAVAQELPELMAVEQEAAAPSTATPAWAQNEFQVLLFSVGKLTLAVPLVTLHSVLDWPETGVTAMPEQPGWCLGLMRYRERNVRIVDTGKLVIPPDRQGLRSTEPDKHILIVGDGQWGLACDAIGSVVTLTRKGVRWRSADRNRPWLAGTVLEQLCALLDTEALAKMLAAKQTAPQADT